MLHLTVGIFGNPEFAENIAKKLGKQGTKNDIGIYNHGSSEGVLTYITVNSEKIQPLLQAINMVDVPVIAISELNPYVGEQIVTLGEFGFEQGFIICENIPAEQIKSIIKGTSIEGFTFITQDELAEQVKKITIQRHSSALVIPIDNHFNVKSVGTVILGIIKSGSVKKYDKVLIEPLGKEVLVKGIQSQDKDLDSAEAGMRIGLNLKGVEADELKRGYIIGIAEKTRSFKLLFHKSKFSKEVVKANDQLFISVGLQVPAARVKSFNENVLEVETDTSTAFNKSDKFLIASTKQTNLRIIGRAEIL